MSFAPAVRASPATAASAAASSQLSMAAIQLRNASPALRRGDLEFVATDDKAQFLGYRRTAGEETLFVGLNRGDAPFAWEIPLEDGQQVAQLFTASGEVDRVSIEHRDDRAIVTVPACDGVVLRVELRE